jgi:hypothetical protein
MQKIMRAGIVLATLWIAGCGQSDMMKAIVPNADQQVARHYLDLLRDHQYDPIEAAIDPSIRPPDMHGVLVRMAGEIPAQPPVSVTVIGFNQSTINAVQSTNVTFEYKYADRWLLENVVIKKADGVSTIIGLNVKPMATSLEASNRFTLIGKGAAQYLVLMLAALSAGVTLLALVLCARARIARRKWLWIVFIIVGFGKLSVNWNSGAWNFMPLSVQLFSASAFAPFYGPWIVAVSFPLGAVWFLLRRKVLTARAVPPALPQTRTP